MDLLAHTRASLPEGRIAVAVSGGRDSMALLAVLAELLPPERLVVAHFDHAIRESSRDDAALVARTARRLHLQYREGRGDGRRRDEASLRDARWAFLESLDAAAIATAHHASDQLETLLLRVLRGTGPRGLAGMRPLDGRRWRPWLAVPPAAIARFAEARGVVWHEDPTNADTAYTRNALRRHLIPPLADGFLTRLAETCAEAAAAVDATDRVLLDALAPVHTELFVRTRLPADDRTIEALTVSMGRPLLREQRARAVGALAHATRGTWGNGLEWRRSCGFDYVTTPAMRARRDEWMLAADAALAAGRDTPSPLRWRTEAAPAGAAWRLPRPGDRRGTTKLKHLFLERRIPAPERALRPVLAAGNQLLWTPLDGGPDQASQDGFPFALSL